MMMKYSENDNKQTKCLILVVQTIFFLSYYSTKNSMSTQKTVSSNSTTESYLLFAAIFSRHDVSEVDDPTPVAYVFFFNHVCDGHWSIKC